MLTINDDTVCEVNGTFGKVIYLYIFYFLCIFLETSVNIAEERVMEERDPKPEWEEYLSIYTDRDQHWK